METKHTPGPWRACHDGNCSCGLVWGSDYHDLPIVSILSTCRKDEGANLGEGYPNTSETFKANYKLVTAAPELLDALNYAIKLLQETDLRDCVSIETMKDVIKRATGQNP